MFNHNIDYLAKLSNQLQKAKALNELQTKFQLEFGLISIFGAELEFFLPLDQQISGLEKYLNYKFIKEKGSNQWEVNFPPTCNLADLALTIVKFKTNLQALLPTVTDIFTAKPFNNDYGSALHIHLNLINSITGDNFCATMQNIDMLASILCHYLLSTFLIFAPNDNSYTRFDHRFMAPINISYGGNNRSTALRIPYLLPSRLEHRVAGSDADPYLVIYTILKTIYLGMQQPNNYTKIIKIHGNAFDKFYKLVALPPNIVAAAQYFNSDFFNIADFK